MQGVLGAGEHYGVPGIGAPGKAYDNPCLVGEIVDDFAFSLVAPLGSDDHYVHAQLLAWNRTFVLWKILAQMTIKISASGRILCN